MLCDSPGVAVQHVRSAHVCVILLLQQLQTLRGRIKTLRNFCSFVFCVFLLLRERTLLISHEPANILAQGLMLRQRHQTPKDKTPIALNAGELMLAAAGEEEFNIDKNLPPTQRKERPLQGHVTR